MLINAMVCLSQYKVSGTQEKLLKKSKKLNFRHENTGGCGGVTPPNPVASRKILGQSENLKTFGKS